MPQKPLKTPKDKEKWTGEAQKATDLPDDEAVQKLFPKKVIDKLNKEIGHEPNRPTKK